MLQHMNELIMGISSFQVLNEPDVRRFVQVILCREAYEDQLFFEQSFIDWLKSIAIVLFIQIISNICTYFVVDYFT